MRHQVVIANWVESKGLVIKNYFFDCLEYALDFVEGKDEHSIKIYDHQGQLVHSKERHPSDETYY